MPINAAPHAAPTIAASEIGVSITRSLPNSSINPSVTLNAPPYVPTSSPITNTVGSCSISSQIPWRIASTSVAWPPRSGRADLCSFLMAVDIVKYSGDLLNRNEGHDNKLFLLRINESMKRSKGKAAQQDFFGMGPHHCCYSWTLVLKTFAT